MSFLPDNLTTSLIFEKQGEDVNSILLLFKVAYCFAQKGSIIYILNKSISIIPINSNSCSLQPSVLERIHFRYFSSSEEVIQWCHQIHNLQKKPSVLIISLKDFIEANDLGLLSLCSAMLDSMIYLSRVFKSRELFFLTFMSIDLNSFIPNFFSFFNVIWLAAKQNNFLQLTHFQTKGPKSNYRILLNEDSSFEDMKKIFFTSSINV